MGGARIAVGTILLASAICSCRTARHAPVCAERDSVRIEVRHETVYVKDTAYIEIPAQRSVRETRDTVSRLENEYALSDAWITPDGMLHHTLETKPGQRPFAVEVPMIRTDSTVRASGTTTLTETVEVERELTWWQQTQMYGFRALILLAIALIAAKIRKLI